MSEQISFFRQDEYSRILDFNNARSRGLSQSECEKTLINAGASYQQAKNGAYIYLHHSENLTPKSRTSQEEYDAILDNFDASKKRSIDCIKHLESLGFSYGQSKTAVYNYRSKRNLIRK